MNVLEVHGLSAGYGSLRVLRSVELAVAAGTIVALLGANGAGKTTLLRALSGMLPGDGSIRLDGRDVGNLDASHRARLGIAHIPQGRGTFVDFTVEENLALGAYAVNSQKQISEDIARWYGIFPQLSERRRQLAGNLSGGEQQMLAIARALMARPRILMCDEPSLGLAPTVTRELFALLGRLNLEHGMTVLLVEQNANLTLRIAHYAYVLENGAIALQGSAEALRDNPIVQRAYLGR
jgi:branched-chain amino acid transport system ATP-binding protein